MTDHQKELLRETFAAHEHLAPDSADVYARVQQIAKGHRIRRIGMQAAGGAVLTAGLVAGGIALPQYLHGNSGGGTGLVAPAAPAAASASAAPSAEQREKEISAFLKAGYSPADAAKLAAIWKMDGGDLPAVMARAGRMLMAGQKPPGVVPDNLQNNDGPTPAEFAAVDKFTAAGFGYKDAERLAKLWKLDGPFSAKIAGGKKLLAGKTLPIKHVPDAPASSGDSEYTAAEQKAFDAYFGAGYDYDDAVRLAKIWKMNAKDIGRVKLAAGKKLLAHEKLPIKP